MRRLGLDGTTLTGTVAAVDASDPGKACQEVIAYASALVRVTADPLPERARLTVVDGWEAESTVEVTPRG